MSATAASTLPLDAEGAPSARPARVSEVLRELLEKPALLLLVLIVLTLPLELSKQLFPYQFIELSRIGMVVGFGVLAVRGARRALLPVPRLLIAGTVVLAATCAASLVLTRWDQGIRLEAAIIVYAGFAFFVAQVVRDARTLGIVAGALLISAIVVAIVLMVQTLGGFYLWREHEQQVLGRRNGTFADPNITARFLALALIAGLALLTTAFGAIRRNAVLISVALFTFGIGEALTQSRAGWLVAALSLGGWLVLARPGLRGLIPPAIFLLGFFGTLYVNPSALTRAEGTAFDMGAMIGQITNPGDATAVVGQSGSGDSGPPLALDPVINHLPLDSVRRYLARAGVAMFLDHPLTGVGLGGFQPEILGPYFDYVPLDRHSAPVSLPHTEAIRIAAETGLVGILASVFFLGAILWSLARAASRAPHVRPAAIAIGLGVLAIGIASQFEGRLFDEPYLWLLIGLTGGLAMVPVLAARDVRPTAES